MSVSKKNNRLSQLMQDRSVSLFATILFIIIVATVLWPQNFPTFANLKSVLINIAIESIVAVGMMNLMISGYIDLSVGSMLAFSGGICGAMIMRADMPIVVAVLITLAVASIIGLFNGFMVTYIRINPMIQTLAMMGILSGLTLVICGVAVTGLPKAFTVIGQHRILTIQMPIWYMIIIVALFSFLNEKKVFFRRYYYIGSNEKAAEQSGINARKMVIINYIICAVLASVAGILTATRLGVASGSAGTGLEMTCITACVLGGANMKGGEGRVIGALLGTVFMGLIDNIIIIAGVMAQWNQIINGIILIAAISLDALLKKKKS